MTEPEATSSEDQPKPSRSEMQLYEQAIRNGWPISALAKSVVMSQIVQLAAQGVRPRDKIAAARVLIAADRNNIQRESLQMKEEQNKNPAEVHHVHEHYVSVEQRRNRVTLLAQRLGVDLTAGADAELEENGSPESDVGLSDGSGQGGIEVDRVHGAGLESSGADGPIQTDVDRGVRGGTPGSGDVGADQESAD